jgi:hypothetical protein
MARQGKVLIMTSSPTRTTAVTLLTASLRGSITGTLHAQRTRGLPPPVQLCELSSQKVGYWYVRDYPAKGGGYFSDMTKPVELACSSGAINLCKYAAVIDHRLGYGLDGPSFHGWPNVLFNQLACGEADPPGWLYDASHTQYPLPISYDHTWTLTIIGNNGENPPVVHFFGYRGMRTPPPPA